jgi:formylglycine-generating enzyme required for sulfatase activity
MSQDGQPNSDSGLAAGQDGDAAVASLTPTLLPSNNGQNNTNPGASAANAAGDGESLPTATVEVGTPVAIPSETPLGLPPTEEVPPALAVNMSPMVNVEGGVFRMGTNAEEGRAAVARCIEEGGTCQEDYVLDSIPAHDVELDDFRIEMYEVSVGQYVGFLNYLLEQQPDSRPHLTACAPANYCVLTTADQGGENSDIVFDGERYSVRESVVDRSTYPVTQVTWHGAVAYCEAIDRELPTEAQWERAARGPANWIYPWGQQWVPQYANTSTSGSSGFLPVTDFTEGASNWGALNMAGNVREWTADWYDAAWYGQGEVAYGPNPAGPISGSEKVTRGGSWDQRAFFARSVHRTSLDPLDSDFSTGFRCVDEADPFASDTAPVNVPSSNNNAPDTGSAQTTATQSAPAAQGTLDPTQ